MEFLKLVILAGIATLCSGQMMGSGDMIPEPSTVRVVTATRFYRDLASYQQIYFPNETGHVIYEISAPFRYSRYNVSELVLCACFEFAATICIEVCRTVAIYNIC